MMQLNYNVTGTQRKEMVGVIANVVKMQPVYKFMPTCAYAISNITVDKNGVMSWGERTTDTTIKAVRAALAKAGFKPVGTKSTSTKTEKKEQPINSAKVKAAEITKSIAPKIVKADTEKKVKSATKAQTSTLDAYFDEMKRIGTEYETARKIREEEKQKIIETKGWDSKELKAWYKREEKFPLPQTMGQVKAYRAWANSKRRNSSELECEDLPFESETADFSDTLKAAGCKALVVTDHSTGLMAVLHALADLGWTLDGLCTVTRTEDCFGHVETKTVQGIRIVTK